MSYKALNKNFNPMVYPKITTDYISKINFPVLVYSINPTGIPITIRSGFLYFEDGTCIKNIDFKEEYMNLLNSSRKMKVTLSGMVYPNEFGYSVYQLQKDKQVGKTTITLTDMVFENVTNIKAKVRIQSLYALFNPRVSFSKISTISPVILNKPKELQEFIDSNFEINRKNEIRLLQVDGDYDFEIDTVEDLKGAKLNCEEFFEVKVVNVFPAMVKNEFGKDIFTAESLLVEYKGIKLKVNLDSIENNFYRSHFAKDMWSKRNNLKNINVIIAGIRTNSSTNPIKSPRFVRLNTLFFPGI